MRNRYLLPILAGVLASALFAACGGYDSPGTTSGAGASSTTASGSTASGSGSNVSVKTDSTLLKDGCKLLTKADAEKALGAPVNDGKPDLTEGNDTIVAQCMYTSSDTKTFRVVQLLARTSPNAKDAAASFEAGKSAGGGITAVEGIGEKAYFNAGFNQLNVLKNKTWLIITVTPASDAEKGTLSDAAKELGKTLAARVG